MICQNKESNINTVMLRLFVFSKTPAVQLRVSFESDTLGSFILLKAAHVTLKSVFLFCFLLFCKIFSRVFGRSLHRSCPLADRCPAFSSHSIAFSLTAAWAGNTLVSKTDWVSAGRPLGPTKAPTGPLAGGCLLNVCACCSPKLPL